MQLQDVHLSSHVHPVGDHQHDVYGGVADSQDTSDYTNTHEHYLNLGTLGAESLIAGIRPGTTNVLCLRRLPYEVEYDPYNTSYYGGYPARSSDPDWFPVQFGQVHSVTESHHHNLADSNPVGGPADWSYVTGSAGADAAHENMPPFLVVNYIIRAVP